MNKILVAILFLISMACANAQVQNPITTKPLVDYTTISDVATGDWLAIWDVSKADLYKVNISTLGLGGEGLLTSNNSWTGSNSFSLPVQMASEYDLTKDYAVSFHNNKYGYTLNGAWNQFVLASEIASYLGDAGDASTFVTKAGNDTITGWKRFNNTLYIYGSTEYQAGTQLTLPYWSNISTLPSYRIAYTIRGGRAVPMWKDGVNPPSRLVDSVYLAAQGQGAFIPSTGTKTGINVNASMSGGQWTFGTASRLVLTPQNQGSSPTWVNGRLYVKAGTEAARIYMNYEDQDYNHLTTYAPNVKEVQDLIDANYSYNAPTASSAAIDTLNFSVDRNFVDKVYTIPSGGITLRFNSDYGSVKVIMKGTQENVTFDAGTSTIKWVGGEAPSIAWATPTNKYWALVFERISSTEILGSWIWAQ